MGHSADARALALFSCTLCGGAGEVTLWEGRTRIERKRWCPCAYRRAFRACFAQYRACRRYPDERPRWEISSRGGYMRSLSRVEYAADFELCGKRTLADQPLRRRVFELHWLAGMPHSACCARLGCGRGSFFHRVYEVECALGKAFLELEPHPLFPRDYFMGRVAAPPPLHSPKLRSWITRLGASIDERARPTAWPAEYAQPTRSISRSHAA